VIPRWLLKALPWLGLVLLMALAAFGIHSAGAHAEQQRQQIKQLQAENTRLAADLTTARSQAAATEAVLSARVESKARIQTVTKEIIREVPVLVPAGTPPLPGGWRVLHDAAATGTPPAPPGGPDEAPVPAAEAAETVVENYGVCRDTADQLEKLQQWVRSASEGVSQ
jgi:hypothetical protein